jgi:hypothetical protein
MIQNYQDVLPGLLDEIRSRYDAVYVIVSPPRCSSTAFARVFWEHPSVRYYCHEPFEVTYYMNEGLSEVAAKLFMPLDLMAIDPGRNHPQACSLVVKEMPYQVGNRFPLLAALATKPILFLIRDPRLNIASRIAKKLEVGDSAFFPLIETGWTLIAQQIEYCKVHHISYRIVDAHDFRNIPEQVFPQVFAACGLNFSPEMLTWTAYHEVYLDNLDGAHRHLYRRVLTSTGIQPAAEPIPDLDSFPLTHGIRKHVAECLDTYKRLSSDAHRIVH